ncbi:MAG TPA: GMC family oxidoreductase [Acidimicrobiales bacterium]
MSTVVIIGCGPGGATTAMAMSRAGWDVVILEKGVNYFTDLDQPTPATNYGNDELKMRRGFGFADPSLEPRTFRYHDTDPEPLVVGAVNTLPSGVGGGTALWDAKVPRFWDIDFKKHEMLGPVEGADVVDWPVAYDDVAPWYDLVEDLVGVAGDHDAMRGSPSYTHAPRTKPFPMPPSPDMRGASLLSAGARAVGLHPFPFMAMINSELHDGRPACISCGFCAAYGCPIHDRGSALVPLRHALRTGRVELRSEAMALRVEHDGRTASGVRWVDAQGDEHTEPADFVVLAAGAVDTSRFALISEIPDPNDLIGRGVMFHWFSAGYGVFLNQRIHAHKGRDSSQALDDFCDPEFPGAPEAAAAAGLPYFRGGVVEIGGSTHVIDEAVQYVELMDIFNSDKPFGTRFKQYMRVSPLRDRLAGLQMIAEDLNQRANRVDLDPTVQDRFGLPAARVTYNPHAHELAAQDFYIPYIIELVKAAGADRAGAIGQTGSAGRPSPTGDQAPIGFHHMGGMRLGSDERSSVTDEFGRVWTLPNVGVADGGIFPTSGAHNPTLTIMAMALRNAWAWSGRDGVPALADLRGDTARGAGGDDDFPVAAVVAGAAAVTAAAAAGAVVATRRSRPTP